MQFRRKKRSETAVWVVAAGVVLTGAAAAYAISRILRAEPIKRRRERRGLEKRVVKALMLDPAARSQSIDVVAIGSGVIELSGNVESEDVARQVVARVDTVPGVHAVVNRLEIRELEARLSRNRERHKAGEGTRWYGGSVGIGRRRQSYLTDPPRRDDHTDLLARSMQPNRDEALTVVEEAEGTGVRIGLSKAGSLTTDVAPPSPDQETDLPEPPPVVAPHDAAQRQ